MIKTSLKLFLLLSAVALAGSASPGAAFAGTITVDTNTDSASSPTGCSLREAVGIASTDVNANGCTDAGGGINDTITFANAGIDPAITIVPAGNANDNLTGDLDIEADPLVEGTLTILGLGQASTTIEGGAGAAVGTDRVLDLEDGTLTVKDLTLKEGRATGAENGGGIRSESSADALNLTNVTLSDNAAAGAGGGLSVTNGTVNVTGSTISGNASTAAGGGLGGGLSVSGGGTGLTMLNSTVTGNNTGVANASSRGAGLYFAVSATPGSIIGTTFSDNESAGGFGGGIATTAGTLNVQTSSIDGNDAGIGGGISASGAVHLLATSVTGNRAITSAVLNIGVGGGMHNLGDATIINSTFSGNSVVEGAAGTTQIQGAAIANGNNDVRVVRSTISGNFFTNATPAHTFGAALTSAGGANVDLINSTVTGNVEAGIGGPLYGFGGGTVTVDIIASTIAGNTFAAGQRSIDFSGSGSVVRLKGSILGDSAACGAGFTAATTTYNVDVGTTCPVGTGSVNNSDSLLGPLRNNGGPTLTRAPAPASPAIDRLPLVACTDDVGGALLTDQPGTNRPVPKGGACDAGAVELVPLSASGAKKCKKAKKKKKKRAAPAAKKKKKKKACGKKKKKKKRR